MLFPVPAKIKFLFPPHSVNLHHLLAFSSATAFSGIFAHFSILCSFIYSASFCIYPHSICSYLSHPLPLPLHILCFFPHTSPFLILFILISFLFRHSASLCTLYFFIPQSSSFSDTLPLSAYFFILASKLHNKLPLSSSVADFSWHNLPFRILAFPLLIF